MRNGDDQQAALDRQVTKYVRTLGARDDGPQGGMASWIPSSVGL